MKNSRSSNIELLRIIAIILIISFHYVYKGGWTFSEFTVNEFIIKVFYMFGELGVNLFMLITGYFMIDGKFKMKKLVLLGLQVDVYHIMYCIVAFELGIYTTITTLKDGFLRFFLPIIFSRYWFITIYVLIYILSPFLNMFAKRLSKKEFIRVLLVLMFLYSVIPTVLGLFFNSSETLLYYNRFIWLVIVYFIGAYIKMYSLRSMDSCKKSFAVSGVTFLLLCGSILVIERFEEFFSMIGTTLNAYFWSPNTILMILLSVSLFNAFVHIKLPENKIINKFASTTLAVYMLHDGILARYWWDVVFKNSSHQDSVFLILHILSAALIIFLIGSCIDFLRQFLEKIFIIRIIDSKIVREITCKIMDLQNKVVIWLESNL